MTDGSMRPIMTSQFFPVGTYSITRSALVGVVMCDHTGDPGGRESAMVVIDEPPDRKMVWCDPCIAPLIRALNEGEVRTIASCCGHGRRPGWIALADGRNLMLNPDLATLHEIDALIGSVRDESGIGRATALTMYKH